MQLLFSVLLTYYLAVSPGEIIMKIPPGINLGENEVRASLPETIKTSTSYDKIEIIVYYFSQGIEKFSYSENNALQESLMKGEIKALIKFKTNNVLRKAIFVAASGTSREQIISNFSRVVADTLASQ